MKTNSITKWAALLLTFSGMAAMSLSAAPKVVTTTGTTFDSNNSYTGVTGTSALYVSGSAVFYSGTNIQLSSAITSYHGAQAQAQGSLALYNSVITTTGIAATGVNVQGAATGYLENVSVSTSAQNGYGIVVSSTSKLTMVGGSVSTTNGYANALFINASIVSLTNVNLSTTGNQSKGVEISNSGTVIISGGSINSTGANYGLGSYGIHALGASRVIASDLVINTNGMGRFGVVGESSSVFEFDRVTINSTGLDTTNSSAAAIVLWGGSQLIGRDVSVVSDYQGAVVGGVNTLLTLTDSSVTATGTAPVFNVTWGGKLIVNGGTFAGAGDLLQLDTNAAGTVEFNDADLSQAGGITTSGGTNTSTVTVNGGSGIKGDVNQDGSGDLIINLDNSGLTGNSNNNADGTLTINGTNSVIVGDLTGSGSSNTNVNLDNSTITGDVNANDDSTIIISGSKGSSITGDINSKDNGTIIIDLDDSKYKGGDINSSGSSNITISGSNGSSVTGTANSKDDSNITINIDGPGSSWVGDTNQQDDSKIIINITGGGSGTGGFNGGDLNVGKDSEFTFDKDSHGNNGKNDGTWNIGDNEVKFDNLENNGKIVINVDTDSGTPKGSVSTDNGSGNGHIVINPGGNGTGNPEDILNGVVNGPGTDGWIWEDIDWGLKELEVTGNPDGSVNVRETGRSSTVSALTIGLIAAQKSSWFAQQNSLLKRMGDLRLNAERTVNISGKEDKEVSMPTADALISNIWIRSYGAQYNYGTQVTGRSFKQYAYGVDLGTDHKWTLNNSNDLYTGVFAGYGAADTDHRYNGSESNLNNYYAGLYASWLNYDGWYADVTLKAQYSDHELKGYHGGIDYFNAKYNNWSVGGSVELGKKFTFQHDWFVEPQLQANYLHILADDYSVSNGMTLNVSELDAFQLRAGIVAGKTLKLKNGGALQPYFKISGVEMVSSGGKIRAGYQTQRPNLDGTHAELGAGIIWQLDAHNQLHLDYEASFGDKYDKPWGLTAGYRYQF